MVFRLEGPVLNIYSTLVVRLAHSGLFSLRSEDMWRNAAIFGASAGGQYGLALRGGIDEGWAELALFFRQQAFAGIKLQFEDFVHAHLQTRALPGTVQRMRLFACAECDTPVSEVLMKKARAQKRPQVICGWCGEPVTVLDREERARDTAASVAEMGRSADAGRDRAAAMAVIEGKRATNDYDVFLCHNSKDKPAVINVGQQLLEHGLLPWLDQWELRPGEQWQAVLQRCMTQIKTVAVFIGPKGTGPWQDLELNAFIRRFVKRKCRVIP